ncbi:uncharacterized protein CcaverHIS019_0301440 [Cutaneotrichosporon cavernicola]|uniref:Uncharacterized protein n=1 Tax=Cutaneotrichosporon cavernicola TaxID=279322 RepID=A0AA48I5L9_9TREE|nr:uncharacterized protein CcaverHIS019_0301440 [Cutaneotrichosporon cavernicola]BEI90074.1 hypothetical protein CcaverHIS019_0301440 [Cutaneotrichosporon cavernicola]BEI97848.1 hypothetical protein CcaverHIS631_0301470 [Cutaneotrichosporon cavernicola]BEJ05625.1 hypothetical protein CcaverHIS641_0301470 [Cutaneotrichosporon cavernicola]
MPPKRSTTPLPPHAQAPKTPRTPRGSLASAETVPPPKDLKRHISPWTAKGFHNPRDKVFMAEELAKLDANTRQRMWARFPDFTGINSDELKTDVKRLHKRLCDITIQLKTQPHELDMRVIPRADERNVLHALATLQDLWTLAKRGYSGKAGSEPLVRVAAAKKAAKVTPLPEALAGTKKALGELNTLAATKGSLAVVHRVIDAIIALYPWQNSTCLFRTPKDGIHETETLLWLVLSETCATVGDKLQDEDREAWYDLCGACTAAVRHMCIVKRKYLAIAYLYTANAIKVCDQKDEFLLTHKGDRETVADELEELSERMKDAGLDDCAHSKCITGHVCC